jgi:hypothetical protein
VFTKAGQVYACLYSTGRRWTLGEDGRGCSGPCAGVDAIAVNGRFVAYALIEASRDAAASSLFILDLRNGPRQQVWQGGAVNSSAGATFVDGLLVTRAGVVAWIVRVDLEVGGQREVHVRSGGKDTVLDTGPQIVPGSLALAGLTLYWTNGNGARSAQL